MCDGIHHCPPGDEYNSDEDPAMCARQKGISDSNVRSLDLFRFKKSFYLTNFDRINCISSSSYFFFPHQTSFGMSIWQQISKEFFSKLIPNDSETTTAAAATVKSINKAPTNKKSTKNDDAHSMDDVGDDDISTDDSSVESSTTKHYRTITLSRGLSKYGPWGYLILGMLLCGGALLVCVLWGKFLLGFFFLIAL